jgi:hypothetical protein
MTLSQSSHYIVIGGTSFLRLTGGRSDNSVAYLI